MATTSAASGNQKNQRGGKRQGAGRPRGRSNLATPEQKASLEGKAREHTDTAVQALVDVATKGKSESARVVAAATLLDRGHGKARQSVEHTGKDGEPIQVQVWHFGSRKVAF